MKKMIIFALLMLTSLSMFAQLPSDSIHVTPLANKYLFMQDTVYTDRVIVIDPCEPVVHPPKLGKKVNKTILAAAPVIPDTPMVDVTIPINITTAPTTTTAQATTTDMLNMLKAYELGKQSEMSNLALSMRFKPTSGPGNGLLCLGGSLGLKAASVALIVSAYKKVSETYLLPEEYTYTEYEYKLIPVYDQSSAAAKCIPDKPAPKPDWHGSANNDYTPIIPDITVNDGDVTNNNNNEITVNEGDITINEGDVIVNPGDVTVNTGDVNVDVNVDVTPIINNTVVIQGPTYTLEKIPITKTGIRSVPAVRRVDNPNKALLLVTGCIAGVSSFIFDYVGLKGAFISSTPRTASVGYKRTF